MPEEAALRCWLCGLQSPGVAMAVKTGDFVGEYHLIPRCADTEACWRRVQSGYAGGYPATPSESVKP